MHFSEDEMFAAIISLIVALILWGRWLLGALRPRPLVCPMSLRRPLILAPLLSLALLLGILLVWSASDVRTDVFYLFMYTVMGAAWVGIALLALPVMGISPVVDVVDRRNAGAGWAVAGAVVGLTLSYAGGNIGDGPGWWVVVFSAGLGTLGMFAGWAALDLVTGLSRLVTVERDAASGVRLGGLLTAMGLIMGRAVAGDWHSVAGTIQDFAIISWPALGLVALEGFLGLMVRPTRHTPHPSVPAFGVMPAMLYIAVAGMYLVLLGWWA
jgi:hypothetical protein